MNTTLPPTDPREPDPREPDPREPGQREPDEREFARILRALPGGDPPAQLDARILRAAHDAVATQSSPRRRALWAGGSTGALWGIGSAAAAILAVGIGWKLTVPPDSALPVPRAVSVAADDTSDQEATAVEFTPMPERRQDAAGPPPPPPSLPPAFEEPASRRVAVPPSAPAAPASPSAKPFPTQEHEEFQSSAPAAAANAEADSAGLAGGALPAPSAAAPAEPRDARAAYAERQREEVLGRVSTEAAKSAAPAAADGERELATQAPLADEGASALAKRIQADAGLAATAWLDRIRARARSGDVDGARASLRLFVQRHPHHAIPVDLRPLLGK